MSNMKKILFISLLLVSQLIFAQNFPEPVEKLHKFSGLWKGIITFEILDPTSGNYTVFRLTGDQNCHTDAAGYSIKCEGRFKAIESNPFFETFEESIQGGYSVTEAQIVWAFVYSVGEAGSLTGNWNGNKLELSRTFVRDGITLSDAGSWDFTSTDARDFLAETKAPDGTVVQRISGTLRK
jgi:hypothetical protein